MFINKIPLFIGPPPLLFPVFYIFFEKIYITYNLYYCSAFGVELIHQSVNVVLPRPEVRSGAHGCSEVKVKLEVKKNWKLHGCHEGGEGKNDFQTSR